MDQFCCIKCKEIRQTRLGFYCNAITTRPDISPGEDCLNKFAKNTKQKNIYSINIQKIIRKENRQIRHLSQSTIVKDNIISYQQEQKLRYANYGKHRLGMGGYKSTTIRGCE